MIICSDVMHCVATIFQNFSFVSNHIIIITINKYLIKFNWWLLLILVNRLVNLWKFVLQVTDKTFFYCIAKERNVYYSAFFHLQNLTFFITPLLVNFSSQIVQIAPLFCWKNYIKKLQKILAKIQLPYSRAPYNSARKI